MGLTSMSNRECSSRAAAELSSRLLTTNRICSNSNILITGHSPEDNTNVTTKDLGTNHYIFTAMVLLSKDVLM